MTLRTHPHASRAFFSDTIVGFLARSTDEVIGGLASRSPFADLPAQKDAWREEVRILRAVLVPWKDEVGGRVFLEFVVPRMGKRIDAVLVLRHVVLVIEFKVWESEYTAHATDQVYDYAVDLKNFHESSHRQLIAPILVATQAGVPPDRLAVVEPTLHGDDVLRPILANEQTLGAAIRRVVDFCDGPAIDAQQWEAGRYSPTPTIIEAATALYGGHGVADISRSDAGATNLTKTSEAINQIIHAARAGSHKSIVFVTGVPGAGKTLVGLNTATAHANIRDKEHSVFLSGNGPLVAILREALARDKVERDWLHGRKTTKKSAHGEVQAFIQNVHNFRDEYARHDDRAPSDHVVIFDEAQRAWDHTQTAAFMKRKRGVGNFSQSEPEFLISCMDRHKDWAVVVCLVGGGQEINTGEAGIGEWVESTLRSFSGWHIHISPQLSDSEYAAGKVLDRLRGRSNVTLNPDLHLSVSMRSFRAENVSLFVKQLLDLDDEGARRTLQEIGDRYPIVLTRDIEAAKSWLRSKARGSERYGLVCSSQASRLKPCPIGIDVRVKPDPVHYFLAPKEDVRSSYYLEDAASEFDVQGLELDWTAVVWDGDFRYVPPGLPGAGPGAWSHHSFVGDRWNRVQKAERQTYLKNAYRVLLTRARQGTVIVVPEGGKGDPTRSAGFYDPTFERLRRLGLAAL